ncbi:uncharacterized protein LOC121371341 [Gigantopelta aegis]|uniref:uncharacterized protein LOC121371341 n=1 Tax=Gigantopelta aegis TaxID=1735272 RepID=UPI001B888256|nr:uncharacterized protein LOC121371341 [Gigantopelta aegis]
MVRIVCPNFQRPRSRHTSGESVSSVNDLDVVTRRTNPPQGGHGVDGRDLTESDCGMSSDSFWESDGGYSVDGCGCKNDADDREAILSCRRQRRRERNKKSAQAYRARRREQDLSQKKTLAILEDQQKELMTKLHRLEDEKSQLETYLRSNFRNKTVPWRLIPSSDLVPHAPIHVDPPRSPPPQTVPEVMNVS